MLDDWRSLPRRLYLDSGVLQVLFDYGETIWEDEPFVPTPRDRDVAGRREDVDALRFIMAINERAHFEFVVTAASIREVDNRGERRYAIWVRDVLDTWLVQSEGEEPVVLDRDRDPNVSTKDWLLLRDALAHRCDTFLTVDGPLVGQGANVEGRLGIRLLRPTTYKALLEPWADLYR